jgi:putative ABC transport system permease protein
MSEIRQALRFFLHRPLVTTIAVVALGTGLGASITAFAVVDRVVLRKPELKDSDRLVTVWESNRKEPAEQQLVSPADFHALRASGVFSSAGAWMKWNFDLTGAGAPERLRGALVSGELFPTLATDAQVGRPLSPADARPGRNGVVVLSDAVWRRVFGADPSVVGRQITVGGDRVTVLGVMPVSFAFPDQETDVWTPLVWGVHFQPDDRGLQAVQPSQPVARRRSGDYHRRPRARDAPPKAAQDL